MRCLDVLAPAVGFAASSADRWWSRVRRTRDLRNLRAEAAGFRLANRVLCRWGVASAAEGLEALTTAGLVPADACDPGASRRSWWAMPPCAVPGCRCCRWGDRVAAPPSLPDLLSWACLGPEEVASAEALAREIEPGARVAWRSAEPGALAAWRSRELTGDVDRAAELASAAAACLTLSPGGARRWSFVEPDPARVAETALLRGEAASRVAFSLAELRVFLTRASPGSVELCAPARSWAYPAAAR